MQMRRIIWPFGIRWPFLHGIAHLYMTVFNSDQTCQKNDHADYSKDFDIWDI